MSKRIRLLCILLFISLFSLYSESAYTPSWLTLDNELDSRWNWHEVGDTLEGRLYQSVGVSNPTHKVLILCSKKSSSYILAFNKLIEVVEKKLPSIEYYFFNFNKDLQRASAIVEYGMEQNVDLIIAMGSEAMAFFQ